MEPKPNATNLFATVWIAAEAGRCPYCGGIVQTITYPETMDSGPEYDEQCTDCGRTLCMEHNDGYAMVEIPVGEIDQLDRAYQAQAREQVAFNTDLFGDDSLPAYVPFLPPMTPASLSDAVALVVKRAQSRVGPGSIGAEQYHVDGQPQKFERMTLLSLVEYALEETLDHINYGVMLTIRLDRLRAAVEEMGTREAAATELAGLATPLEA